MVEHQPKSEPVKQRMRIHRKYRTTSTRTSITRITDSEFIERKVLEIENSFQPARYPLRVGHIVGFDAPGCDILSFKTEDHREKFRSGKDRNINNVIRFIEVKGRKNEGAEIELRGNEQNAAVKYGKRYYLYRLYQADKNKFILSILQDPINADEAIEPSVYVHLDRASTTEQYEITGGSTPNNNDL